MKRTNKFFFFLVVLTCICFYQIGRLLFQTYVDPSGSFGFIKKAGNLFVQYAINVPDVYPTDENLTTYMEVWRDIQNNQSHNTYLNADKWIIIKNIPKNPPNNLIVLATWNIDPSSLRTKITDKDWDKKIRFIPKNYFSLLSNYAVLIRADSIPMLIVKNRPELLTYEKIYKKTPFDLTTNQNHGVLVKYLKPDGKEIIPTND